MLATLTLAAALIGGPGIVPGDVPPFAALHRAAAPDSLPGPVTLAPRCTGCALEVVVSGLGMVDTSTPPSPIGLQEGTPPTSVN